MQAVSPILASCQVLQTKKDTFDFHPGEASAWSRKIHSSPAAPFLHQTPVSLFPTPDFPSTV